MAAMKFWKWSVFLMPLFIVGCSGSPAGPDTALDSPTWVKAMIGQFETQRVTTPPAFVARYDYKGQDVYFVPQRCCDIMSVVYNSEGTIVCHPDGGFTGKGDEKCADFLVDRRNERIVWRNSTR